VTLRDDIDLCAPQLYRFACALVSGHPGPCAQATDLVRAVLSSPIEGSMTLRRLTGDNLRIRLYSVLIERHRRQLKSGSVCTKAHVAIDNFHLAEQNIGGNASVIASPQDNCADALLDLGLEEREALLLVALEGFNYAQAARILKISPSVLVGRLARARAALSPIAPEENFARPVKPHPPYLRLIK